MSKIYNDEFHGIGGQYVVGADGKRKQVVPPTKEAPDAKAAAESAPINDRVVPIGTGGKNPKE